MKLWLQRAYYILPPLLWMALIYRYSSIVGTEPSSLSPLMYLMRLIAPLSIKELSPESIAQFDHIFRKTAHVSEYAILMALLMRGLRYGRSPLSYKNAFLALLLTFLYACSDEFHQRFVPGRSAAFSDVMIDTAGASALLSLFLFWRLHEYIAGLLLPHKTEDASTSP